MFGIIRYLLNVSLRARPLHHYLGGGLEVFKNKNTQVTIFFFLKHFTVKKKCFFLVKKTHFDRQFCKKKAYISKKKINNYPHQSSTPQKSNDSTLKSISIQQNISRLLWLILPDFKGRAEKFIDAKVDLFAPIQSSYTSVNTDR